MGVDERRPPLRRPAIGVVGSGAPDPGSRAVALADEVGTEIARRGAVLVCGGLGGVMEAACRGASRAGGLTVGILPGRHPGEANDFVEVAVPTGLGELRNGVIVLASDALVAVGGEFGTLSEIALALKQRRPVVGLGTWHLQRPDGTAESSLLTASSPEEAVALALRAASDGPPEGA